MTARDYSSKPLANYTTDRDFFKILDYDERVKFFKERKDEHLAELQREADKELREIPQINKIKKKYQAHDAQYMVAKQEAQQQAQTQLNNDMLDLVQELNQQKLQEQHYRVEDTAYVENFGHQAQTPQFPNLSTDFGFLEQVPDSLGEQASSTFDSVQKQELQDFIGTARVKELREYQQMTTSYDRMLR
jgi:CRISPR/Cas system CSM-associated protein Csm5 (group 7 of RAMP superfamily)